MAKRIDSARASQELVDGYTLAADLSERRQMRAAAMKQKQEAVAWGKVATYCRNMAKHRYVDAPESEAAYVPPAEETLLNLRVLDRILDCESEESRSRWTTERQMALIAALQILSATERVIAQMYYGGLMDVVHIARAMKTTSGTVEGYLARIRKKWARLRLELQDTYANSAG